MLLSLFPLLPRTLIHFVYLNFSLVFEALAFELRTSVTVMKKNALSQASLIKDYLKVKNNHDN